MEMTTAKNVLSRSAIVANISEKSGVVPAILDTFPRICLPAKIVR